MSLFPNIQTVPLLYFTSFQYSFLQRPGEAACKNQRHEREDRGNRGACAAVCAGLADVVEEVPVSRTNWSYSGEQTMAGVPGSKPLKTFCALPCASTWRFPDRLLHALQFRQPAVRHGRAGSTMLLQPLALVGSA